MFYKDIIAKNIFGSGGGGGSDLPSVNSSDNGDVLQVKNGEWAKSGYTETEVLYSGTGTVVDDVSQRLISLPYISTLCSPNVIEKLHVSVVYGNDTYNYNLEYMLGDWYETISYEEYAGINDNHDGSMLFYTSDQIPDGASVSITITCKKAEENFGNAVNVVFSDMFYGMESFVLAPMQIIGGE